MKLNLPGMKGCKASGTLHHQTAPSVCSLEYVETAYTVTEQPQSSTCNVGHLQIISYKFTSQACGQSDSKAAETPMGSPMGLG